MSKPISRNQSSRPTMVAPGPAAPPSKAPAGRPGTDTYVAPVRGAAPREVARGTLRFDASWNENLQGELRAGGQLTVDYDPARTQIHHSHNGFPAWGVQAYVKFLPGGELVERPAVEFVNVMGRPTSTPKPAPFTVDIPAKAERVEIWFRNWTGADHPAEVYDSNYGANYVFDVSK